MEIILQNLVGNGDGVYGTFKALVATFEEDDDGYLRVVVGGEILCLRAGRGCACHAEVAPEKVEVSYVHCSVVVEVGLRVVCRAIGLLEYLEIRSVHAVVVVGVACAHQPHFYVCDRSAGKYNGARSSQGSACLWPTSCRCPEAD